MRIVLDLQACQSGGSRARGIGRFEHELVIAMLDAPGADEFWIALNGAFEESTRDLRATFEPMVGADHVITWRAPGPTAGHAAGNAWRAASGKVLREAILAALAPDWVHIGSMFEGYSDGALASASDRPVDPAVAVTHHDLIPMVYPDDYLPVPLVRTWYAEQLDALRRARLVLTNSEFTRQDAITRLELDPDRVVRIGCATSGGFVPMQLAPQRRAAILTGYGITRAFVMYAGGVDARKNVAALVRGYARLPGTVRAAHQLVFVGSEPSEHRARLLQLARSEGLADDDLAFTNFVDDAALVELYNLCSAFVYPSLYEGFGLPVLEAMACGAPVIASNATSLPEVIDDPDALFDPHRDEDITRALFQVLTGPGFRAALVDHGKQRARDFSWRDSARRALDAMRAASAGTPA